MSRKQFSYKEAINEIESTIKQIENEDIDIDELLKKVKHVSNLINLCKNKLSKTEEELNKIINKTD